MNLKRVAQLPVLLIALMFSSCASTAPAGADPDKEVEAAALERLSSDALASGLSLAVSVDQGVATVQGVARDAGAKARALSIIRGTPGIKGVVDNTTR